MGGGHHSRRAVDGSGQVEEVPAQALASLFGVKTPRKEGWAKPTAKPNARPNTRPRRRG